THYAGYNCGACFGRPGSVNARSFSALANMKKVRECLKNVHGITIPEETIFIGGLHDTSRDDIAFFDLEELSEQQKKVHDSHARKFLKALDVTAKERSRRFMSVDSHKDEKEVHDIIRKRTV